MKTKSNIAKELAALRKMSPAELRDRYADLYGEPSRSGNKQWLIRRCAWRIQSLAEGEMPERAERIRGRAKELARDQDIRVIPPKGLTMNPLDHEPDVVAPARKHIRPTRPGTRGPCRRGAAACPARAGGRRGFRECAPLRRRGPSGQAAGPADLVFFTRGRRSGMTRPVTALGYLPFRPAETRPSARSGRPPTRSDTKPRRTQHHARLPHRRRLMAGPGRAPGSQRRFAASAVGLGPVVNGGASDVKGSHRFGLPHAIIDDGASHADPQRFLGLGIKHPGIEVHARYTTAGGQCSVLCARSRKPGRSTVGQADLIT